MMTNLKPQMIFNLWNLYMLRFGTWIPDNLKSDHQKLDVPSKELDVYQDKQIETLDDWHNFSIENDILYSLYAGSLIGFYRTGYMIPWDDDIDLVVRPISGLGKDRISLEWRYQF